MKKIVLLVTFGFATFIVNAQEINSSEVPAPIKDAFAKLYPNAKVDQWEKENNVYEAEFKEAKKEMAVSFSMNGQLIETEKEMSVKELPQGVTDYIEKNLKGKRVKKADSVTDNKGHVVYEVEIGSETYVFDSSCNYIRTEKDVAGDK
jgi:FKBP-type peptidyl-prolyl cis-trans isomerase